jgi:carboxymethylenebutenolidase
MGKMIDFSCPNTSTASGYYAQSSATAGIVLLQEWWGLNEQMKQVAQRVASAGFNALVPDLYQGRVTQDPDEAGHMMEGLDWVGATAQEVRGAAQHLKQSGGKVAVMGYCMGGALSIIAGVTLEEADAIVCYYGIPPTEQADPAQLRVPMQAHFANSDDWCTPQAVNDMEATVKAAGRDYELYRYDAQHGFFNAGEPTVYDEATAELSWQRALEFLNTQLRT